MVSLKISALNKDYVDNTLSLSCLLEALFLIMILIQIKTTRNQRKLQNNIFLASSK